MSIKENGLMIKRVVKVEWNILTAEFMKENGNVICSMEEDL
jgi:hypothetical protein